MDPHLCLENLFEHATEVSPSDDEYGTALMNWQHQCVTGIAGVSLACNAWLLLTGAAVALHSKQVVLSRSEKDSRRIAILERLQNNPRLSKEILRMTPAGFNGLCEKLKDTAMIRPNSDSAVAEQVAYFLFITAQKFNNRSLAFFVCRSGETISRYFHNVLRAVISLEAELLKQPKGTEVAPKIHNNSRFYPYFKDCIGAVDGTHVRVKVAREDAAHYRGRKEWPTQNVLVCCSFDMRFTYVLAGYEGSASDSRVLKSALTRDDALHIPPGKYFHADAGYGLSSKVLTPYGRTRYHLKEYFVRGPQNAKELFNLSHASLRNTIERTFGVLKKRFPILGSGAECQYSNPIMTKIVIACCIMHNFLVGSDEYDGDSPDEANSNLGRSDSRMENAHVEMLGAAEDYAVGVERRDEIAHKMWEDYIGSKES